MFSANSSQVSEDRLYVEDVFSTYLYTGNQTARTITNGIDLAGKGGMVWTKCRSAAGAHAVFDTNRGTTGQLNTGSTNAAVSVSDALTAYGSTGYSIGADNTLGNLNNNGFTFASWTFREAPKFFDVVTYTGNGTAGRTVAHSLGVVPGCMIVKRTDSTGVWLVYHRSRGNGEAGYLNLTNAFVADSVWNYTDPTATQFTVASDTNTNGATYVAYLFAHDTTSDGIIQCGSYTGNGNDIGPTVTLGWEPQWLFIKRSTESEDWVIYDNMRGVPTDGIDAQLSANLSNAEQLAQNRVDFTATGFIPRQGYTTTNASGSTYIYIAIRRGPMRTPTSGTSVFSPQAVTLSSVSNTIVSSDTAGPMDVVINQQRSASGGSGITQSRLTGGNYLITSSTSAEASGSYTNWDRMTGTKPTPWTDGQPVAAWQFRRAPSFFDVVCYTGTGTNNTISHNLGVQPELIIIKRRNAADNWPVWSKNASSSNLANGKTYLNQNAEYYTGDTMWSSAPTATQLNISTSLAELNASGGTYVAYLFASCPGVSKVGSYTGNGSSQTINCGFAAGARFVMIKRTDSTGDWYVWDTARGIVAGNDPRLSLNSTAAEVTTDDSVDTDSSGFVVNQLSATNINVNAATYLYMAVA